jgi:hypothetical protein
VSLESQLKDLQNHISQELANFEGSALELTYSAIKRTCAHQMWKFHAQMQSSAHKVRSSALS